jgi:hypothetical protein
MYSSLYISDLGLRIAELQKIISFARCSLKSEIRNPKSGNVAKPWHKKKGAACVAHPFSRGFSEFRPQVPRPIPVPRREAIPFSQRVEKIHALV